MLTSNLEPAAAAGAIPRGLPPQLEAHLAQPSACVCNPNRSLRSYASNHLDVNGAFAAKMALAVHRPPKIVSRGCASQVPRRNCR